MAGIDLPSISIPRGASDLATRAIIGTLAFTVADTFAGFQFLDEQDRDTKYGNLKRAGLLGVAGYMVDKWSAMKSGTMRDVLQAIAMGLYFAAGSRLLAYFKWTARVERFATPNRFRPTNDGGLGHTALPAPEQANTTTPAGNTNSAQQSLRDTGAVAPGERRVVYFYDEPRRTRAA